MTKRIRVENADISDHTVVVQTWTVGEDDEPDRLTDEQVLSVPTDLRDFLIWKEQYLVIKEG